MLAFISPGIDGDPVKLNPNRFVLKPASHRSSRQRKVRRIQCSIASLIENGSMRLRRIESSETLPPPHRLHRDRLVRHHRLRSALHRPVRQILRRPSFRPASPRRHSPYRPQLHPAAAPAQSHPAPAAECHPRCSPASPFVCPIAPLTVTESVAADVSTHSRQRRQLRARRFRLHLRHSALASAASNPSRCHIQRLHPRAIPALVAVCLLPPPAAPAKPAAAQSPPPAPAFRHSLPRR